jgi:hypothetical protein
LNLKSNGKWVTCYIELQSSYSGSDIGFGTATLNNAIHAMLSPTVIGEYNSNRLPDLIVKFDRSELQGLLSGGQMRFWVNFRLMGGQNCSGTDLISVIQ